jgi:hypothetical protein
MNFIISEKILRVVLIVETFVLYFKLFSLRIHEILMSSSKFLLNPDL